MLGKRNVYECMNLPYIESKSDHWSKKVLLSSSASPKSQATFPGACQKEQWNKLKYLSGDGTDCDSGAFELQNMYSSNASLQLFILSRSIYWTDLCQS